MFIRERHSYGALEGRDGREAERWKDEMEERRKDGEGRNRRRGVGGRRVRKYKRIVLDNKERNEAMETAP